MDNSLAPYGAEVDGSIPSSVFQYGEEEIMNTDRYQPKIAKQDLVHGAYYEGRCRNATVARWNAERECFVHWRTKFGQRFIEEIRHPEDDQHYDVFVVERVLDNPDQEIPFR